MKETAKAVKIGEYEFLIHPFNAFDGAGVFLFATKKIIPLLKSLQMDINNLLDMDTSEMLRMAADMIGPVLDNITPEELKKFMADCLQQVEIHMDAGYNWLYRGGTFAVEEIEYSTKICLVLCFHALKPILRDFFGDVDWSSILNASKITNQ